MLDGGKWLKRIVNEPASSFSKDDISAHSGIIDILTSFYLFGKDSDTYDIARKILLRSDIKNSEDIFGILVKIGVWHPDENLDLLQLEIPIAFSEEIQSCAEKLGNNTPTSFFETPSEHHRRDLTDLHTITIDGQATLGL